MPHRTKMGLGAAAVFLIAGALWFALGFTLSAVEEPGRVETYAATLAKQWFVSRAARNIAAPSRSRGSAAIGQIQFRGSCAACHGLDGRQPSEIGRWMYPRASDLGSPEVQQWSDAELFWMIKHGVRLSGMPGFGKVLSDEQIWPVVHYLRTLPKAEGSTPDSPPR